MIGMLRPDSELTAEVIAVHEYRWLTYLRIDGILTGETCGHNHSREDLAVRCVPKLVERFRAIQKKMTGCVLLPEVTFTQREDLYEVTWLDDYKSEQRRRWLRFYAPHVPSSRD